MSPQSEAGPADLAAPPEYSPEERGILLGLAHRAIESEFHGHHLDLTPPTEHLAEMRGAFTTLHLNGKLRGCIGYVAPTNSLFHTVAETARSAAFDDPRFTPVTAEEVADLEIEISVLSPLRPIRPEEIVVGRHGLVIRKGLRRGLLLPQVPVEWRWNRETFLAQTCKKAGLAMDAWEQGAEIQAFTAEVFGDIQPRESDYGAREWGKCSQ
jgi:AmmeMemoRadiSam system protein A